MSDVDMGFFKNKWKLLNLWNKNFTPTKCFWKNKIMSLEEIMNEIHFLQSHSVPMLPDSAWLFLHCKGMSGLTLLPDSARSSWELTAKVCKFSLTAQVSWSRSCCITLCKIVSTPANPPGSKIKEANTGSNMVFHFCKNIPTKPIFKKSNNYLSRIHKF